MHCDCSELAIVNMLQICSASRDGSVRVWDGTSQTLMSAMDLRSAANKNDKIESRGAWSVCCSTFLDHAAHAVLSAFPNVDSLSMPYTALAKDALT